MASSWLTNDVGIAVQGQDTLAWGGHGGAMPAGALYSSAAAPRDSGFCLIPVSHGASRITVALVHHTLATATRFLHLILQTQHFGSLLLRRSLTTHKVWHSPYEDGYSLCKAELRDQYVLYNTLNQWALIFLKDATTLFHDMELISQFDKLSHVYNEAFI
jgi:hypothetical protein